MVYQIGKNPCPNRKCGSSDAFHWYSDATGGYCFSCGWTVKGNKEVESDSFEESMKEFSDEDHKKLKEITSTAGRGFRGIADDVYKQFGVRHEYSQETGQVIRQYYPVTTDYKFSGYKVRTVPKDFYTLGTVGNNNNLFGQYFFQKNNSKFVIVVGGEVDQLSAFQILRDYQKSKGSDGYEPIPVVSPTVGETNAYKQMQKQYEWFNRFDKIILCFDSDEAGKQATEAAIAVLPVGKVYIADMTLKDPNEYLVNGREREFVSLIYSAKAYSPAGVIGSEQLYERLLENAATPKIPLPPFMRQLSGMTAGGFPLGYVINLGAGTGVGKTSFVNELIYYWVFNSPHTVGVVSMELNAGQYGEVMLSRHLGKKISLIADPQEKLNFLMQPEIRAKAEELFKRPDGASRWHLVDDRNGGLAGIKKAAEKLIVACGCKVVVLDPLQDVLEGCDNEHQALFMQWQKQMIDSHEVTFININHVNKGSEKGAGAISNGGMITEEDFTGSSTIIKSAGANILFTRNKNSDDEVERNTTKALMSKCRWTGLTGPAGQFYYDNETHTLHEKEAYFQTRGGF